MFDKTSNWCKKHTMVKFDFIIHINVYIMKKWNNDPEMISIFKFVLGSFCCEVQTLANFERKNWQKQSNLMHCTTPCCIPYLHALTSEKKFLYRGILNCLIGRPLLTWSFGIKYSSINMKHSNLAVLTIHLKLIYKLQPHTF